MMEMAYTKDGQLVELVLDAVLREKHLTQGSVTEFTVESGGAISDHLIKELARLEASIFVTNTPIISTDALPGSVRSMDLDLQDLSEFSRGANAGGLKPSRSQHESVANFDSANVLAFDQEVDRVSQLHDHLSGLMSSSTLLSISTSLTSYDDMVVTAISTPRESKDGESATIDISLVQMRFADTGSVDVTMVTPSRGSQETNEVAASGSERESLFHNGIATIVERFTGTGGG